LNTLVGGLIQFIEYTHINFNPKKCRILIHNAGKVLIPPLLLPDANNIEQEVEVCNIKDTGKYIGVPLNTRKLQKMKFNKCGIGKTMKILERFRCSRLKIPQLIDAIRRFISQKLDYTMMNNIMEVTELSNLDQFIRIIINEMVGNPALSKDLFYIANKNGGL
jgi:hypothetical protein